MITCYSFVCHIEICLWIFMDLVLWWLFQIYFIFGSKLISVQCFLQIPAVCHWITKGGRTPLLKAKWLFVSWIFLYKMLFISIELQLSALCKRISTVNFNAVFLKREFTNTCSFPSSVFFTFYPRTEVVYSCVSLDEVIRICCMVLHIPKPMNWL